MSSANTYLLASALFRLAHCGCSCVRFEPLSLSVGPGADSVQQSTSKKIKSISLHKSGGGGGGGHKRNERAGPEVPTNVEKRYFTWHL